MFDLIQEHDGGPLIGSRTSVYIVIPADTKEGELTARGKNQIDDLVHSRMITSASRVYSPASAPAKLTAERLAQEFEAEHDIKKGLEEVSYSSNEKDQKKIAETIRAIWSNPEYVPYKGESLEQAENRIAETMNRIVSKHRNDSIIAVIPPMIGSLFIALVVGGVPTLEQWLAIGHASCAMFEYQRSSWSLIFPLDNSFLGDPSTVQDSLPEDVIRYLLQ